VVSCSKHAGFVDSLTYFKKKVYSDNTSGYKVIPRGAFGFPSNHIEEGSIGRQNLHDRALVSPIYCVFQVNPSVHEGYLHKLLKTDHYRQIFSATTNSSVDRRGSLRWKEFAKIKIPLPNISEQKKISAVIDVAELETANLRAQLACLEQQRQALMLQLLTGKRRLRVDERAA
jgi:type I restriction enzyme, S subunit